MIGSTCGGQPDQQGRPEVQAAPADQSYMEFDSVISDEAVMASEDSAAVDSADGSADQEGSSDEYSELEVHSTSQLGAPGMAPDADAGAPAGGVQQVERERQLEQPEHTPDGSTTSLPELLGKMPESENPVRDSQEVGVAPQSSAAAAADAEQLQQPVQRPRYFAGTAPMGTG